MVIYSMTRKESSYGQLVHYILEREAPDDQESFVYLHGFDPRHVDVDQPQTIIDRFRKNAEPISHMDSRIKMYHEIMSFAPEDSHLITKSTLLDISRKYAEVRGHDGLVMARPHFDKNHIHVHFMISGNKIGSSKSMRVSKKEFEQQKLDLQDYQLKHYPELLRSYARNRNKEKEYKKPKYSDTKQTQKRKQMEAHKRPFTVKEGLQKTMATLIPKASSLFDLVKMCQKQKCETYQRAGIPQGIIHNGKKYRFSTLAKHEDQKAKIDLMRSNAKEWYKAEQKAQKILEQVRKKQSLRSKQKNKRKYKP